MKNNKENIEFQEKDIRKIQKLIDSIESNILEIKSVIYKDKDNNNFQIDTRSAEDYIEGIFDGRFMIDKKQKKYLIPENYVSKSKLVTGDILKLVIAPDGTHIFKQISPIERKKETGVLQIIKDNYNVKTDKKIYKVIKAAVTYFKAKEGDKLTIIIPKDGETQWAAIENKIIKEG